MGDAACPVPGAWMRTPAFISDWSGPPQRRLRLAHGSEGRLQGVLDAVCGQRLPGWRRAKRWRRARPAECRRGGVRTARQPCSSICTALAAAKPRFAHGLNAVARSTEWCWVRPSRSGLSTNLRPRRVPHRRLCWRTRWTWVLGGGNRKRWRARANLSTGVRAGLCSRLSAPRYRWREAAGTGSHTSALPCVDQNLPVLVQDCERGKCHLWVGRCCFGPSSARGGPACAGTAACGASRWLYSHSGIRRTAAARRAPSRRTSHPAAFRFSWIESTHQSRRLSPGTSEARGKRLLPEPGRHVHPYTRSLATSTGQVCRRLQP